MEDLLSSLIEKDDLMGFIALTSGLFIATLWITLSTIQGIVTGRAKEATKRELAAYVAEGSLDPKDAVAMIEAGKDAEA